MSAPASSVPAFDAAALRRDISRQSTLHSWYKHLPLDPPALFYLVPALGQQPRNEIHPQLDVGRQNAVYWHFFRDDVKHIPTAAVREIVAKYPVAVNPFFFHDIKTRADGKKYAYGFHIIHGDWHSKGRHRHRNAEKITLEEWLAARYPELEAKRLAAAGDGTNEDRDDFEAQIFEAEYQRIAAEMVAAGEKIWRDLAAAEIDPKAVKLGGREPTGATQFRIVTKDEICAMIHPPAPVRVPASAPAPAPASAPVSAPTSVAASTVATE